MPRKTWPKPLKNWEQAHNWLLSLEKRKKSAYGTEQIRAFLKLQGNPQDSYKVIHVGGTSGKGSACQMLAAILKQAGYKTGMTISPYLVDPLEKMQINQRKISKNSFVKLVKDYRDEIIEYELSYFEAYIALTLIYFAQQKVDYAVVEVGMGGRLDATNVFNDPELAIITNIGLDHTHHLGNTKQKIAREKAAIIKDPKKAITGSRLIKNAKYIRVRDAHVHPTLRTNLLGEFQKENALLASVAAKRVGIKHKHIKAGLLKVKNPGRFEIIKKRPLVIMDGAHNPDKMKALVKSLLSKPFDTFFADAKNTQGFSHKSKTLSDFSEGKIVSKSLKNKKNKKYLIIAIKEKKDYKKMLKIITPLFDEIILTTFDKGINPRKLKAGLDKNQKTRIMYQNTEAYAQTLKKLCADDLLVITGSLYLLGDIKK